MLQYFKNHLGLKLSDEQFEDIPYPMAELITHVCIKNVQFFGTIGAAVVGPVSALITPKTRSIGGIYQRAIKCGKYGAVLGILAGPALTYAKVKDGTPDAVWDRCYRLRHNRGQVRVDQWSFLSATAGSTATYFLGQGIAPGAIFGMITGIGLAAKYNSDQAKAAGEKSIDLGKIG